MLFVYSQGRSSAGCFLPAAEAQAHEALTSATGEAVQPCTAQGSFPFQCLTVNSSHRHEEHRKPIWAFQTHFLLCNLSLTAAGRPVQVLTSNASATGAPPEENQYLATLKHTGSGREQAHELKDGLMLRRDSLLAFSIFLYLQQRSFYLWGGIREAAEPQSVSGQASRGHNHPTRQQFPTATSLHGRHTQPLTPSTRQGFLFPFSVQRVVHLSLSLLQRRCSTSRESSPKNVSVMLRCWVSEGHLISPEWLTRANFLSMKYLTIHEPPVVQ